MSTEISGSLVDAKMNKKKSHSAEGKEKQSKSKKSNENKEKNSKTKEEKNKKKEMDREKKILGEMGRSREEKNDEKSDIGKVTSIKHKQEETISEAERSNKDKVAHQKQNIAKLENESIDSESIAKERIQIDKEAMELNRAEFISKVSKLLLNAPGKVMILSKVKLDVKDQLLSGGSMEDQLRSCPDIFQIAKCFSGNDSIVSLNSKLSIPIANQSLFHSNSSNMTSLGSLSLPNTNSAIVINDNRSMFISEVTRHIMATSCKLIPISTLSLKIQSNSPLLNGLSIEEQLKNCADVFSLVRSVSGTDWVVSLIFPILNAPAATVNSFLPQTNNYSISGMSIPFPALDNLKKESKENFIAEVSRHISSSPGGKIVMSTLSRRLESNFHFMNGRSLDEQLKAIHGVFSLERSANGSDWIVSMLSSSNSISNPLLLNSNSEFPLPSTLPLKVISSPVSAIDPLVLKENRLNFVTQVSKFITAAPGQKCIVSTLYRKIPHSDLLITGGSFEDQLRSCSEFTVTKCFSGPDSIVALAISTILPSTSFPVSTKPVVVSPPPTLIDPSVVTENRTKFISDVTKILLSSPGFKILLNNLERKIPLRERLIFGGSLEEQIKSCSEFNLVKTPNGSDWIAGLTNHPPAVDSFQNKETPFVETPLTPAVITYIPPPGVDEAMLKQNREKFVSLVTNIIKLAPGGKSMIVSTLKKKFPVEDYLISNLSFEDQLRSCSEFIVSRCFSGPDFIISLSVPFVAPAKPYVLNESKPIISNHHHHRQQHQHHHHQQQPHHQQQQQQYHHYHPPVVENSNLVDYSASSRAPISKHVPTFDKNYFASLSKAVGISNVHSSAGPVPLFDKKRYEVSIPLTPLEVLTPFIPQILNKTEMSFQKKSPLSENEKENEGGVRNAKDCLSDSLLEIEPDKEREFEHLFNE